jgi:hypothetical protein
VQPAPRRKWGDWEYGWFPRDRIGRAVCHAIIPPASYAPRTERALAGTGHSTARYAATHALWVACFGQPTKIEPRHYIFVNKTTGRSVESPVLSCTTHKTRSRLIPEIIHIGLRPGIAAWGPMAPLSYAPRAERDAIGWPAPFWVAA